MNHKNEYWIQYDGLQAAKHRILSRYLGGWFPILSTYNGKVLYIDCHAGRGMHETGDYGSPILALNTLLTHKQLSRILANTEVFFYFFETDKENCKFLKSTIRSMYTLPQNVKVNIRNVDYEKYLRKQIDQIKEENSQIAPSFAFLDPFNFDLSMDFINCILAFPCCEVFITFMWRYIDLAITHENQSHNLDKLFGTHKWIDLRKNRDRKKRIDMGVNLFVDMITAEYKTIYSMISKNNTTKYLLIHATNHLKGRELMKDSMWYVSSDGSFCASERETINQPLLLQPKPDLSGLKNMIFTTFKAKEIKLTEIDKWVESTLYLKKHLHEVLKECYKSGEIEIIGNPKRLIMKDNPTIIFK